ncbi:hypothetical protein P2H44_12320 [Albimonas sp. CAU 1670]|uniref:hypothetical protein n=1 Tax=Albimonas sp. CAU 1670 TaxID=3032599 RepID=UPI0023DB63A2|nr:hypothetical protein [Albimonas sp. CAU 1670]MDF2233339.1 hypothetical protein [Albimonas sp. CAU 1670]
MLKGRPSRPGAPRPGKAKPALPDWIAPSPRLSPADRERYAGLIAGLQALIARPREKVVTALLQEASARVLLDLAAEAVRTGAPWKRFSTAVMEGTPAAALGEEDLAALLARLAGTAPALPGPLAALEARVEARRDDWACGAGCWMCCAINARVTALPGEVRAAWEILRHLPEETPPHPRACPALGADGLCRVYAARPAVCGRLGSTDVAACEAALARYDETGEVGAFMQSAASALDPWAFASLLADLADEPKRHVDLVTCLRRLRAGAPMAAALTAGRAAHLAANPGERNRLDPPPRKS